MATLYSSNYVRRDELQDFMRAVNEWQNGAPAAAEGSLVSGGGVELPPALLGQLDELLARLAHYRQGDFAWYLYSRLVDKHGVVLDPVRCDQFLDVTSSTNSPNIVAHTHRIAADMKSRGLLSPRSSEKQAKALILAHTLSDNFEEAREIFKHYAAAAATRGESPPSEVSLAFIRACGRAGEPDLARRLRDQLFDNAALNPLAASISLNAILSAFAKQDRLEEAMEVFKQSEASGLEPNTYNVNALLQAYYHSSQAGADEAISFAAQYFAFMREGAETEAPGGKARLLADQHTVKILMDICLRRADDVDRAAMLLERARAAGVPTDKLTDLTMVRALIRARRSEHAFEVYLRSRERLGEGGNLMLLNRLAIAAQEECYRAATPEEAEKWMDRVIDLYHDGIALADLWRNVHSVRQPYKPDERTPTQHRQGDWVKFERGYQGGVAIEGAKGGPPRALPAIAFGPHDGTEHISSSADQLMRVADRVQSLTRDRGGHGRGTDSEPRHMSEGMIGYSHTSRPAEQRRQAHRPAHLNNPSTGHLRETKRRRKLREERAIQNAQHPPRRRA